MQELRHEVRAAIVVVAILLAPYLCWRASRAGENDELLDASVATGWVEISRAPERHRIAAAPSQHRHATPILSKCVLARLD